VKRARIDGLTRMMCVP